MKKDCKHVNGITSSTQDPRIRCWDCNKILSRAEMRHMQRRWMKSRETIKEHLEKTFGRSSLQ